MNRNKENFLKIKTTLEKFSFDRNVQKKVFFYYFNSENGENCEDILSNI